MDTSMDTRTITIDTAAYEALRRRKKEGQSFSDVIKQHVEGDDTGRQIREQLERLTFLEETLDALNELAEAKRSEMRSAPDL